MKKGKVFFLVVFLLLSSVVPVSFLSVGAVENPPGIFLIRTPSDWILAGFENVSSLPVYTPVGITEFWKPVAIKKEDVQNLQEKDVEHTFKHMNDNFTERFVSVDFEILESATYWVVLYHMVVKASTKGFSGKCEIKIKGEELGLSWWNSSFSFFKPITFDSTQISGTHTNFVVPLLINTSELTGCQADFGDVAFVYNNETQFNHEIEPYNSTQVIFWVNFTEFNSTTQLEMYYDSSTTCNMTNNSGVWDTSQYIGVWHMNDNSSGVCNDSTTNVNHGVKAGDVGTPTQTTGFLGFGQTFVHANDQYLNCGAISGTLGTNDFSAEIWFKTGDSGVSQRLLCHDRVNTVKQRSWYFDILNTKDSVRMYMAQDSDGTPNDNYNSFAGDATTDVWSYVSFVMDWTAGDDTWYYYENGSFEWSDANTITAINPSASSNIFYIGIHEYEIGSNTGFGGEMDEVRLSCVARTADYFLVTYNSIINCSNGSFFTIGGAVAKPVTPSGTADHVYISSFSTANNSRVYPCAFYNWSCYTNNSGDNNYNVIMTFSTGDTTTYTSIKNQTVQVNLSDYLYVNQSFRLWINTTNGTANWNYYLNFTTQDVFCDSYRRSVDISPVGCIMISVVFSVLFVWLFFIRRRKS